MSNRYDKMDDYVTSMFSIFKMVNNKAEKQQDKRLKMIALTMYNYVRFMSKEHNIDLQSINNLESINLIPVFEYVAANNIEFYDFSNININDLDVTKREDLERFVLSHVYYITQGM